MSDGGWFTSAALYTRRVKNEHGALATVTLRPLNSGDKSDLEDTVRMIAAENGDLTPELKVGTMKRLTVERAVQSWTLPGPTPTAATIAALNPHIFEQIFALCTFSNEPPERFDEDGNEIEPSDPTPPQSAPAEPSAALVSGASS